MDILKTLLQVVLPGVMAAAFGQQARPFENLSIDRPDISNLPVTVQQGHYQFEIGFEYDKNNDSREYYLPSVLLRTGLGKKTELRLGSTLARVDSTGSVSSASARLSFGSVAVKHRLVEEKGWIPAIGIQPEINITYIQQNDEAKYEHVFDLLLLFNNTFHEQVFLNYNLGWFWINSGEHRYLLSASLSFLHTHRLGYFVEAYTLRSPTEHENVSFDGGVTFLVSPRFQLDAYVGKRWAASSSFKYMGLGVGVRFDRGDLAPKSFKDIGIHH